MDLIEASGELLKTLEFLINLAAFKRLEICLLNVVIIYMVHLNQIFIILEGFKMLEAYKSRSRNLYLMNLQKSLYGLKTIWTDVV